MQSFAEFAEPFDSLAWFFLTIETRPLFMKLLQNLRQSSEIREMLCSW